MPHGLPLLEDLLIVLLASLPIAFIFNRLRLPSIVGFIITGVVIGPHGFGAIRDAEAINVLAEIGVALLLFTIGLEFSLRRILEMKRLVILGGGLQVVLTIVLIGALAYFLGRSIRYAIFFGFLSALSSTAIVLKSYIDRAEVDSPHGRVGIAILLFQDLSIVPMMLMIPILGGRAISGGRIALTLAMAVTAVVVIVFTARKVMPYLLHHIVRLESREVFIISIVVFSLGTAWLTSQFGLSLALGAFVAGIVLSESEYSHQIVADILPFRDVFNSLFFISVGMLLSLSAIVQDFVIVLGWVGALLFAKVVIVLAVLRILRYSLRVSIIVAIGLAQAGEFSFILAKAGLPEGLLSTTDYQRFLAASVISMIATPFLIKAAPTVGYSIQKMFSPSSVFEPSVVGFNPNEPDLTEHVVIVGYGVNGHNLAKVLRATRTPYLVLELDAEVVRAARAADERIVYGDATRKEVLHHVGIERARILVLAISDPTATRHAVSLARQMNPKIHIIVRTRYMAEMADLLKLGANEVIPEEFETGIEIFARVLRNFGMPRHAIQRQITAIRAESYEILRAPAATAFDLQGLAEALTSATTETVIVEDDWKAVGKSIGELQLRTHTGVSIIAMTHENQTELNPGPETILQEGDVLVLLGSQERIEKALNEIGGTG